MKVETPKLPVITEDFRDEICTSATAKLRARKPKIKLDPRTKPVMSAELELEIESAMAQYENLGQWKTWGLDTIRQQGNAVLLYGPPGTGKTTIAKYMSKRIGKGMLRLNMKDVGGKAPGHTERMVAGIFTEGKQNDNKSIFIDECESVLWDRGKAGADSMWMVGVIDEILMQVAEYKGLILFATNREDIIDPALYDRCFASLQVPFPQYKERLRLWEQKMPDRFPLKLTVAQREALADYKLSGRNIETVIVREASLAIVQKRLPTFEGLKHAAQVKAHGE